jgi:hypothetical protein
MGAVGIAAAGANITTGGTTARIAIPTTSAGTPPRFVRVAVSASAYVRLGDSAVEAAAGTAALVTPDCPLILRAGGFTHIAAIQLSGAGVANVCPLEDV